MFTRITKVKKNGKTLRYLKLVENYWEKKKTRQRVIANFGNVDKLNVKRIDSAIASLIKFSSRHFVDLRNLKSIRCQHLGEILAADIFWDRFQLSDIMERYTGEDTILIKAMIVSRLIEPLSKLRLSGEYYRMALSGLDDKEYSYQHFYRAMDTLIAHKEDIESEIYDQVRDLFNLKLNLVFYDITSSYFEGQKCPLSSHGYSRDHRFDREQILLGLLVTDEGIPIAHTVFNGNLADKTTVKGQIRDISRRFGIKRCIIVVDRGMVSTENLSFIEESGYDYIVALRKRSKKIFEPLLSMNDNYKKIDENLLAFETTSDHFPNDRIIICFNKEKSEIEKEHRNRRLERVYKELETIQEQYKKGNLRDKEKMLQRGARILERRKVTRFFTLRIDEKKGLYFAYNKDTLSFEELLDGKFILRTNEKTLEMKDIIRAYKNLAKVENAFCELKDFIKLRPIRHFTERRVKAHVFICVLAYLIEIAIELTLHQKKINLTAREALNQLSDIKLVSQEVEGLKIKTVCQPKPETWKILKALTITLPKEKIFR